MPLKKINENPKITDTILLEIETPGANGCFAANPYKVDRVVVYYIERDFLGTNYGEYTKNSVPDELQARLVEAESAVCDDPSLENLLNLEEIREQIDSATHQQVFYYKDRVAVKVIGTDDFPAWLSTDTENAFLTLVDETPEGEPQFGHYTFEWNPEGKAREGDYFVCWTWSPNPSGEKLSAHVPFIIYGDERAVSAIPTHITPEDKYEVLLERYLPEMYKYMLSDRDITPDTTDRLNQAIGKGFKFLEDMANQIIDLFDANVLHESMLMYLSNLFGLKLKSGDPTLWRRQIKQAIPLFKKKGSLSGLTESFAQAGMTLNTYDQLWQIVSPYTFTETFLVASKNEFELTKSNIVTPIDEDNFGLWIKTEGGTSYTELDEDYVEFDTRDDGILIMTWIGDEHDTNPIELSAGDRLKIKYQHLTIANPTQQQHEDYIQSLPLMDQRNENDQMYPPKNWNVHLISENDVLFNTLVPVRHPFHELLIFGHVRTEFAYSENIYNMEEYNGSIRPSYDPCYIDKDFVDPCGACLSSCYTVDVSMEELSNDRLLEAQDILREFTPFHARLHTISFAGDVNEFVASPVERIETLIKYDWTQHVISGNVNPFFHRSMDGVGTDLDWQITRDDLTELTTVLSGKIGTAFNDIVAFVAPDINLRSLGIDVFNHVLEVLAPSVNAGNHLIANYEQHTARVTSSVTEPVNETAFTFNLSNIQYNNTYTTIEQDDLFKFSDDVIDIVELGVKTQWDVENTDGYTGGPWKISIPAYSATAYEIADIIDGKLILDGDENLPVTNTDSITYNLLDDNDVVIESGTDGHLLITRRAIVNLNDSSLILADIIQPGDSLYYDGTEYPITRFETVNLWIEGYSDGDANGVTIEIRRRLATEQTGYFGYRGLRLTTFADHEAEFGIVNGSNPPVEDQVTDNSLFKENFLFIIDGEYYRISAIDGINVILNGRDQSWTTLSAGGTTVSYGMAHLEKQQVNAGFTVFDHLDRDGQDPVIRELYSTVDENTAIVALSASQGAGMQESIGQIEGIQFTVETRAGNVFEGEL